MNDMAWCTVVENKRKKIMKAKLLFSYNILSTNIFRFAPNSREKKL